MSREPLVALACLAFLTIGAGAEQPIQPSGPRFHFNRSLPLPMFIPPREAMCDAAIEAAIRRQWLDRGLGVLKLKVPGSKEAIIAELDRLLSLQACRPRTVMELNAMVDLTDPDIVSRLQQLRARSNADVIFIWCEMITSELPQPPKDG